MTNETDQTDLESRVALTGVIPPAVGAPQESHAMIAAMRARAMQAKVEARMRGKLQQRLVSERMAEDAERAHARARGVALPPTHRVTAKPEASLPGGLQPPGADAAEVAKQELLESLRTSSEGLVAEVARGRRPKDAAAPSADGEVKP